MDKSSLERWRQLNAETVLCAFAEYAKKDSTFHPIKHPETTRWHAHAFGHEMELLLTGPKFWDARSQTGGGGAIDLVVHLSHADFKTAVRLLREKHL